MTCPKDTVFRQKMLMNDGNDLRGAHCWHIYSSSLRLFILCRQDRDSVEAQMQLQAELDRWQHESNELSTAVREAQAGREQAEEHLERLQGSLRDLQRHSQDRGNYDELQARFKEVSKYFCIGLPIHHPLQTRCAFNPQGSQVS